MNVIKLNPNKTHRFNVNNRFLAMHLPERILIAQVLELEGEQLKVKEVIKDQTSRYYKKHNYYEVRV